MISVDCHFAEVIQTTRDQRKIRKPWKAVEMNRNQQTTLKIFENLENNAYP